MGCDDASDVESVCSNISETGSFEAPSTAKVYIGSELPYFVTEQVIRSHFLEYGFGDCITGVKLVCKGSRFMGFGCVYFKTVEDAQNAISTVNGTSLIIGKKYKHKLEVKHYVHKTQLTSPRSPSSTSELPSKSYNAMVRRKQSNDQAKKPFFRDSLSSVAFKTKHRESKKKSSSAIPSTHTQVHIVQLMNCHMHISEDDIRDLVCVPVVDFTCEPTSRDVRTVYITVNTHEDASKVIATTNGKSFFDCIISATTVPAIPKASVLYFSTSGIIGKVGFERYLNNRLPKYAGKFKITSEAVQKNYSQFEVQFLSTNTAKRAFKVLKKVAADYTVSMDGFDNRPLIDEISDFQASVRNKKSRCIDQHRLKLDKFQTQLKQVQIPKNCPIESFNKLIDQRAAREQQVTECKEQEAEFVYYCDSLEQQLEHLKPSVSSHSEDLLSKMRKNFGRECSRLLKALPIYAKRQYIVNAIWKNQVVILIGQTGSGKSTQIVQYLYDAGLSENGIIVCTQPRKVAAVSLAKHVSSEMSVRLGTTLGYKMGTSGKYCSETKVLYMTDHTLLNECIADRDFSNYSCLVIDEAHERSLHTDLLLAFIKQVLPRRPDLRVVITSATIDPTLFNTYFGGQCPILKVPGRTFPVDVVWNAHLTSEDANLACTSLSSVDYIANAMKVVKEIHSSEEPGDVLVFLPDPMGIEKACESLSMELPADNSIVLPLHGKLQPEDQQKVFHDYDGKRKIVLCTNIAETSVTIPGVKYIVDSGLAKELCFDPKRSMNSLEVRVISQSSAEQRKGRAGRTSAGKCYRLYSEEEYQSMKPRMLPEILRVHLAHACLKLYEFGISYILSFDFVEQPDSDALKAAVETLIFLGAVDEEKLTDVGKSMAVLPLDPHLAKILLDGIAADVGPEAAAVVAISSLAGSVFFRGGSDEMKSMSDRNKIQFCHSAGDQISYLSVYCEWLQQKRETRTQWCVDNFINAKSMRLVEETIKELRDILTKKLGFEIHLRSISVDKAAEIVPKLFFNSFIHNLSVFLGHERVGFSTERMPEESLVVFPGSSLNQLNLVSQLQCVVFEKTLKTSQNFLLQVVPVKEEWIQEAIQAGILPYNPVDKFRNSFVSPTTISNIGQQVYRNTMNFKTLPKISKELTNVCEGTHNAIELQDREKGMVHIFCQPRYHEKAKLLITERLDLGRLALRRVRFEEGVTRMEDNVRIVLGLGGCIEHVLMPYQHRGVVVKGPDNTEWTSGVLESLLLCGDIERHNNKIFGKPRQCRLFVTFYDPEVAQQVVLTLKAPEGVTIQPQLPISGGEMGGMFRLNVEWCRRMRKNFAFLDFSHEEDFEIARSLLVGCKLYLSGCWAKVRPPKDEKMTLFVANLSLQAKEEDLEDAVKSYLLGHDIKFKARCGYERAFETTEEQFQAMKKQLESLIEDSATKGHYHLTLLASKAYFKTFRGYVTFENPNEGEKTLSSLRWQSIGDQSLTVKPALFSSNRYTPAIYNVIKDSIEALKPYLQDRFGNKIKLSDEKKDNWGNTIVQITSDDIEAFTTAKRILNAAVNPDVIECYTPILRQFVLSHMCQSELTQIQSTTDTYILFNHRNMSLCLYGTEANQSRAKISLNSKLDELARSDSTLKEFKLKAVGQPPGIMKHLVSKFGIDLQGMIKEGEVTAVELDARKHILSVYGTQEAHKSILEMIEQYCQNYPARIRTSIGKDEVECCTCFTPIETPSEIFRLEYCGHAYCLDCVSLQVSPNAIVFPVLCAADGCDQPFVWQDFLNILKSTKFKLGDLKSESLKAYMKANKDKVRNCPTPDCGMVYTITEDGRRFICSSCGVQTCTKCHAQYHDGLSCEMYNAGKHGEKEFEEWLQQNPTGRKRCPKCKAPIEKVAGCNNVCCTECKSRICWVCLAYFNTDQDCYAHLHKAHGGFFQ